MRLTDGCVLCPSFLGLVEVVALWPCELEGVDAADGQVGGVVLVVC